MSTPARAHDFSLDPDALLRETAAAEFLDFKVRALQDWRRRGGGPPFVSISRRAVRYRRGDLIAWSVARNRTSTSDPGPQPEAGNP